MDLSIEPWDVAIILALYRMREYRRWYWSIESRTHNYLRGWPLLVDNRSFCSANIRVYMSQRIQYGGSIINFEICWDQVYVDNSADLIRSIILIGNIESIILITHINIFTILYNHIIDNISVFYVQYRLYTVNNRRIIWSIILFAHTEKYILCANK